MSPNRHSISAVSTAKKLNTPLKASVVLLTAIILSSCATNGGDNPVTPKPTPVLPGSDNGGATGGNESDGGGSNGNGSDGSSIGAITEAEKAIKAAEAKTKAAEEALKVAEAKTKAAEDALKAAEKNFGEESEKAAEASKKAIEAARAEATKAKAAAEAARVEAVVKIEASAKASKEEVNTAKKAAADAVAKVKAADEKAKAADIRAVAAETKAKEIEESLKAETAAKKAAEAKAKKADAEKKAAEAKTKVAEAETKTAQAKAKTAEEKAAAAIKAVAIAKAEADKKVAAIEKASASQIAAAKQEAKIAQEALKTAEAQAINAAKAAAKAAADAATAAAKEAAAKLEAVKTASASQIAAAKKEAAAAQARADKAIKDATAAQDRAEKAEANAKSEAEKAAEALQAQAAAEAKTKVAEAETKTAQANAKTAEEKAAAAIKAVAIAKAEADKKVAAIEKASASQIAAAKQEAKIAQEALKTAEAQAINAAKAAAKAAADAATAAAKEAAAKLEAVKTASASQIAAAKKEAAAAQARADKAVSDAAAAQIRVETAEATAKLEAEKAAEALQAKQKAEQAALTAKADADAANKLAADEKAKAATAQAEADKAKGELITAQEKLAAAEKALADALASGSGNTAALQAEVDRRKAALDAANAQITAAQQAQAAATAAAEAQVAAANQAAQAAKDALAAATIKNAPEAKKSGVQSLNINVTPLNKVYNTTTRDFESTDNSIVARADIASESAPGKGDGLLGKVAVTTSGTADKALTNGFMSHTDSAEVSVPALGQTLPLTYTSTYKDFGDDMRIGHIDGKAVFSGAELPVNGVAVIGNATQAANMPKEGKVGYTGDATYRKLGIGNDIEFGKSVFTADFVAKNVKGDLSFANAGKIGLTAGISGNQFSGSADANGGYLTEGGFFGGDAQYLGGVYEGNGAQGTYGAKSDKQTAAEKAAIKAQADADKANAAIAGAQAQAAAAQAAADKAQADAIKAQEALKKAEENLANAGNGEDQLAAALARAAAAEAAEAAALQAAATAETARVTAVAAQAAAEAAAKAAENAANEARGDADEQKAAKERAEAAKAVADKARNEALAAKIEADKAKDEALVAKAKAESARDEAIARAEAAEAEALEAANQFSDPDSRISGFQSTSVGKEDGIFENNVNSYDKIKLYINEVDGKSSIKPIELTVRGANKGATDSVYSGNSNGFKQYKGSTSFEGRSGITIGNRNLSYSSVYKNFDDQMQIGHIKGDIKQTIVFNQPLSTVYVQGNATNLGDMSKLTNVNEGKAKYNGVASYIEGGNGTVVVDGKSKFDVDFVAKSLKGELTFTEKQVDIAADITNNTFASKKDAAVNTVGGFYGKGASLLGGVFEREDSSGYIKGTYGATKLDPTVEVVPDPTESKMTGFQSTALSSRYKELPFGQGTLDNAIGYVEIRDDNSAWTELKTENGSQIPVDNGKGDNFTSFSKGKVLADMVKPDTVLEPITVNLTAESGEQKVEAGRGSLNPTYKYNAVYKNFDSQMQTGHVYGNLNSIAGDVSRAANVYVEGYLTSLDGMNNLKNVNDGKAQYTGVATYIENIHLADNASTAPVNGRSAFNVDFVDGLVDGTLSFDAGGYKYMPAGNEIKINAGITGNTFAGNVNGIDTAGGFYGKDAQFLGGIYQDASVPGGKGTVAGTGTKFQGTFGAEKQ